MLLQVLKLKHRKANEESKDVEEELTKAGKMWDLTMTLSKHIKNMDLEKGN